MPICVYCGTTKNITGSYKKPTCKADLKKYYKSFNQYMDNLIA